MRAIALGLTALTGFSGLVYEVAWQKYLATLLGSHSEATAAVLALFLGGLSLGYALFGRVTRRVVARAAARGEGPRLLLLYGCVEAGIGSHALLFPLLFRAVHALSFAIAHRAGGVGFALDVALAALLILPPTVLMGGTIPILTQALARSLADATRIHAFVYAFNSAGAFVGALAGGLVLIPWLGLERVVLAMGAVNLAAGSAFGALGLRHRDVFAAPGGAPAAPAPSIGVYAAVAALIGFAAMTLETVLIRMGGLSLGSSSFTFAMVVAVFVLCIALGSFAVSALPRIGPSLLVGAQWALAALLAALYPLLPAGPYAAHVVRTLFRDTEQAFYPYQIAIFLGALGVLAVPVGLSGATLPLLFHQLRRELGDLGGAAGRLYAWNTLGSLVGALFGGYLLFYWLDLDQVYRVALAAVVLAATALSVRVFALPRLGALAFVALPLLAGIAWMPRWDVNWLAAGAFRMREPTAETHGGAQRFYAAVREGTRIVYYKDDPNSSVSIFEARLSDGTIDTVIATNAKPDGSIIGDYPTEALLALLPAAFTAHPEYAFVIGYGTGVTVGELGALDSMKRVTVAEISPGVIAAAPYFERWNQGALGNPKTEVVISDAYRALLRSDQRYDIIVSEPSNPWVTGVEMLFSREFLSAARDRLAPGGVYAQWFHLYENDTDVVELVLRTYAAVFDHVAVWYTLGPDLLLLGFQSPERALDVGRLAERAAAPDLAAGLRRAHIESFPALLAHELLPLDVVNAAHFPGDVHTLLHPVLSQRAARAFYRGLTASLPPTLAPAPAAAGAESSLLRRFAALSGGRLSDDAYRQTTREACNHNPQLCATLLASWMRDLPSSPARDALLPVLRAQPSYPAHLGNPRLRHLIELLGSGRDAETPPSPEQANLLTDLYVQYYHHAAPFSREVLARAWQQCRPSRPGDGSCAKGLAAAEARVGPLQSQTAGSMPSAPGALR